MAAKTFPIAASTFEWAWEESSYSRSALADKVNLPVEVRQLTRGQITDLIKALKRPLVLLSDLTLLQRKEYQQNYRVAKG